MASNSVITQAELETFYDTLVKPYLLGTNYPNFAPIESGTTASDDYAVGALIVFGGRLCEVTTAITSGDTIAVGTNVKYTSVEEQLSNASGGGHVIEDSTGTDLTQRDTLKVSGPLTAEDDSTTEKTVIGLDTNVSLSGLTPPSDPTPENSHYAICSTTASTVAKEATPYDGNFALTQGTKAFVQFTYSNTASAPTLQVGNTAAKSIKAFGTTAPSIWWSAGDVVQFIFDGTNWIMQPSQGQISEIKSALANVAGMPDYTATPIASITAPQSYTATEDCYIVGYMAGSSTSSYAQITNGASIWIAAYNNAGGGVCIPLKKGATVSINDTATTGATFQLKVVPVS